MKMKNNERGFTMLEIMLVIGIIGGLGAVLYSGIFSQADKAKAKTTQGQINDLVKKVKLYKLENAKYPESWDDLIEAGSIDEVPVDAWFQELNLEVPGTHGGKVDIWSVGADEQSDTDDDIVSWSKDSEEK